jgi:hypothetical protein
MWASLRTVSTRDGRRLRLLPRKHDTGVDTAKLLIDGKPVERNIPVPLALVTQ